MVSKLNKAFGIKDLMIVETNEKDLRKFMKQ